MDKDPNAPTQFKVDIPNVELALDAEDIAQNMLPSEVVQLVIELDKEVGEWEVTLLLHRYFSEQVELARRTHAVPHLVDASEDLLWDSLKTVEAMDSQYDNEGADQ